MQLNGSLLSNRKPLDSKDTGCKELENGKQLPSVALGSDIYKYFERRVCARVAFILNECSGPWRRSLHHEQLVERK